MSRFAFSVCAVLLFSCVAVDGDTKEEAESPIVWETADGIRAPESVYYAPAARCLYVSNIGDGGATGRDGDGFISKLDMDGKVLKLKWVAGLDAPKGMRIHEGTLWVTDIDRLVKIDIAQAKILARISVPEATFLNDVACAADGTVFVSDTMNSRIISYRNGEVSVFAEGDELECPNGLLVLDNRLIVAAWGRDPDESFSTKVPGRLLSLDLKTKQLTPISAEPTGNHDGLESDGASGFFVTDWVLGKILHIAEGGTATMVAQLSKGTADLAYVPEKKMLVVPWMLENKVIAVKSGE